MDSQTHSDKCRIGKCLTKLKAWTCMLLYLKFNFNFNREKDQNGQTNKQTKI